MPFHRQSFTVAVTCISRLAALADRILGRIGQTQCDDLSSTSRHAIPSGSNLLDAAYVEPVAAPPRAVVLICHGIAETVDRWLPVQQLLASHGVASMVFDYSGFGKSTGHVDWRQCEIDAISAFRALQQLAPAQPVSLLGFSLGSGIAAAVVNRVDAHRLILCAAFTSFRAGARAVGLPALLNSWAPPIWSAEHSLQDCRVPVLVVHGERDRLFPVQMARDLASQCGTNVELIILPNVTHTEPFYSPRLSYWGRLFP
jgi:uncharacterized protein